MEGLIRRQKYMDAVEPFAWNGNAKVITGIRRCGKSYLLNPMFKNYLIKQGVPSENIISFELDKTSNVRYRNPLELAECVRERVENKSEQFYLFIDEVQFTKKVVDSENDDIEVTIYDMLNELKSYKNLDVYVTGSNSRLLSKDLATNFRDRGVEIQLYPLTFSEYYEYSKLEKSDAWEEYMTFGGMPLAVLEKNENEKAEYLRSLFTRIYIADIKERYKLKDENILNSLIDVIFSSVGSLTNPHKLTNTLTSVQHAKLSEHTVKKYLEHLEDSFIIKKANRYDIKGKRYLQFPSKYYAVDIGLRNARLNFRQQERTHIMENIIYNHACAPYAVVFSMIQCNRREAKSV